MNRTNERVLRGLRHMLNNACGTTAEYLAAATGKRRKLAWSVCFLLGPPRSGSTLLMQVLTDAFDFAYISNTHCRWYGAPWAAEKWLKPLENKQASDFTSHHGRTMQPFDPAECAKWWYRFFRREPAYVTTRDVGPESMKAFRRSVALLEWAAGKPLIFKNLYAGVRLEPIVTYLPESVFIVMERDLVANAQSILRGRYDTNGEYESWWSVPPPNVEELRELPPVQQAVEQIRAIHAFLDCDLERLGAGSRVFRVGYEEFCGDVHGTLERFARFMEMQGVVLRKRFAVPERFTMKGEVKIPQDMYEKLCSYVDNQATNQRGVGREYRSSRATP